MLLRSPMKSRLAAALIAAFVGAMGPAYAAPADDLREAQRLYTQGRIQPATEKVEAFLRAQPKDPQGRFLKGLLLTEAKRVPEAIQVFTSLTEDFPELPEPYNNLAVLYASQGDYDKAKSALELAIHTHPSYATAHENLGDIYAQLASRAYDRALQLDKNNTAAQLKLSMVKDLFTSSKSPAGKSAPATRAPAATPAPDVVAKAEPAKPAAPPKAEPAPRAQPEKKPEPPRAPAAVASVKPAAPAAAATAAAPGNDEKAQVTAAIERWARAWSAKDVKGYLATYAPDFEVPGGDSRAEWEKQRTERIERPKSIDVDVKVQSIKLEGNEAVAVLRQAYRSDTLRNTTTKTLRLVRSGDRWLIKQERVGG